MLKSLSRSKAGPEGPSLLSKHNDYIRFLANKMKTGLLTYFHMYVNDDIWRRHVFRKESLNFRNKRTAEQP